MDNKTITTVEELLAKQKKKNKKSDLRKIRRAFEYADKMHQDQVRLSGEKYIIHPLNVAYILADLGLDDDVICAALLHDVIEDTTGTYEEISNLFSEQVAIMVEGVTKLRKA
ncbi:MAG: HD domain-containing protein [Clostridiales bacterium]|nr:HD domain-containing protein [Clostridiales bacterium]